MGVMVLYRNAGNLLGGADLLGQVASGVVRVGIITTSLQSNTESQ